MPIFPLLSSSGSQSVFYQILSFRSKVKLCCVSFSSSGSIYLIISVNSSHVLFLCFLKVLVSKVVVNLFFKLSLWIS